MTVEEYCRAYDQPSTTVRRVLSLTPRSLYPNVGVERSGNRTAVIDPHLLRTAVVRHMGASALPAQTLKRLATVARWAAEGHISPSGMSGGDLDKWRQAVGADAEMVIAALVGTD